MDVKYIDGLPGLDEFGCAVTVHSNQASAFVNSTTFTGRIGLGSGNIEWCVEESFEYPPDPFGDAYIRAMERNLWHGEQHDVVATISQSAGGGVTVTGRKASSGEQLWTRVVPLPQPAPWAEVFPAWPGASTEELYAFLAADAQRLILCLFRQTRRSTLYDPFRKIDCRSIPPFQCQLDAIRLDPANGNGVWETTFPNVPVWVSERNRFKRIWSNDTQVGVIDFETGTNRLILETPGEFGWPVRHQSSIAIPWHRRGRVGVTWIEDTGHVRQCEWRQTGVKSTQLHPTEAGLVVQANDQMLWCLGSDDQPKWKVIAKPYIYAVDCAGESLVYVGTDGNGGRLYGFDQKTVMLKK